MSSEKQIILSRAEQHQRVWSTPMRTLAKEFGLSDVGLAKVCAKHQIPRPEQGHWVRVHSFRSADVSKSRLLRTLYKMHLTFSWS
jgi:hypothetical protein